MVSSTALDRATTPEKKGSCPNPWHASWPIRRFPPSFSTLLASEAVEVKPSIYWQMGYIGLLGLYLQHVISTFNTCLQVPTPRSLTNTDGGYNLRGADFPHHSPHPSQSTVLHLPLKGPILSQVNIPMCKPNLKSRCVVVTYISRVVSIPHGFYRILWLRLSVQTAYNYE
jgi:hypothetical protein